MDKAQREIIFNKYGGRCAYCGCELVKGWHVSKLLSEAPEVNSKGEFLIKNDTIENKLPSCAACNMSRTRDNSGVTYTTIEDFRKQILYNLEFVQSFPYYQRCLRFGLIEEKKTEIVFYFEQIQLKIAKEPGRTRERRNDAAQ